MTVTAPNGAVTTYVYDGFGDLIQTSSPDTGKTVYRYDPAGNLTQKVDAAGATNQSHLRCPGPRTHHYLSGGPGGECRLTNTTSRDTGSGLARLTSVTDDVGQLKPHL